ncbi:MAG: ribosome biogenesis GTPase YlqF [Ruminococcus sp.]|nr:ribosome biogenesis GTPase YlqF [Ruminococcus sp.]
MQPKPKPVKVKKAPAPTSSEHTQVIQWYPGHMTKTKRRIEKDLKLVDAVAEIIDARIPISSRNPDIAHLTSGKPRIVLLNKCDMADSRATAKWVSYLSRENVRAIPVDCKSGRGVDKFVPVLTELLTDRIESYKAKGMVNPSMRVMIVGIPNVGKSTFINRISKKTKAVSADRPGVTRGNQWFTVSKGFEMLDTPGVLWPKFDDQTVGEHLAFTGAIKSEVMDTELLAVRLLDLLKELNTSEFTERYKLSEEDLSVPSYELLEKIARNRGMLISGGEADTERAAYTLLDEFRAAKLGRITLELPQ